MIVKNLAAITKPNLKLSNTIIRLVHSTRKCSELHILDGDEQTAMHTTVQQILPRSTSMLKSLNNKHPLRQS